MIVGMRTRAQAAKVAAATGGAHLAGKSKPDGVPRLSRYVDVGADFEAQRPAVESVSVLFDVYDGDADCYAQTGSPGAPLPTGWVVTAAKFEVEWPAESQRAGLVRSHFGARRKAFNWGLAKVKADLDAKAVDPVHESVGWDLGSLRWAWNRAKDEVAPWWAQNSKEAYSSGLADLARALDNWSASSNGTRRGRRVGFPRFKSARRDAGRVRFTTGTMRCGRRSAHHHRARDRAAAIQGEHPPGAASRGHRARPHSEHDALAALGPVVRFYQLRAARTGHCAHGGRADRGRWHRPRGAHVSRGRHPRHHHRGADHHRVSESGPAESHACCAAAGRA